MPKGKNEMERKKPMSSEISPYADKIITLIEEAKQNALKSVNAELIKLYWNVGEYLSKENGKTKWGDSFIDETAKYIRKNCPEIKGFDRRGLYRMKRFYETYKDDEIVTTLLSQISWSNHLEILAAAKTQEERQFYIMLCVKEKYSVRELRRQISSSYFHRYMLSKEKLEPVPIERNIKERFLDTYVLEFLDLPEKYKERDLRKAIIHNLKNFILEIGRDFSFVGEEYRVQAGYDDFYIDLLFYHRGLSCLVVFELKTDKFMPEYIGKMNFYLEVLDREYKKPNENPSVGVILCASKNDEVVEIAMNRSLSPTLVSEYSLQLIDKKLLEKKLREYGELLPEKTEVPENE
jgi:predicted nuclease of restriction endonuclease-like (RecB) superfamily